MLLHGRAQGERSSGGIWKFRTSSFKSYVDHSHTMYSSGNIDVRKWAHLFESHCIFKVRKLLVYCTRSQWWGCYLSFWAGWFSVGVSSPSRWRSPFSTRQWCWFWSTPGYFISPVPTIFGEPSPICHVGRRSMGDLFDIV